MYIADLHIHSKYSRATSRDCDLPHLDAAACSKGLGLLGSGDFTHPAWREEMRASLEPAEDGLYVLRDDARIPGARKNAPAPRFVVSGEISTIYKKADKTRKVHHLILLPSLEDAEELSRKLELIGNIRSDGRPILGLDSRDLMEITLDTCPDAIFIPAHIWTPHFSLFGAFSQFSTIEECYGDMTRHIHALETGLSSDPPMNRRLSALDKYQLVSNSDAHSPAKLAREANILDTEMSYPALRRALETGEGLAGTIEFFPEEGKYHLDGHRACKCRLEPAETRALNGLCPVCGRKVTVGVQHRVDELSDRTAVEAPEQKPFESLMPLEELVADCLNATPASKKVRTLYAAALDKLGSEMYILREAPLEQVASECGALMAEALRRLRAGDVVREAGYDGEYGKISLFRPGERDALMGQTSFIDMSVPAPRRPKRAPVSGASAEPIPADAARLDNPEQLSAIRAAERTVAVIAGPGTGKTHTLVERAAYMISEAGVKPSELTAVTFTNQAVDELRARLEKKLGKRAIKGLTVGTFHSVCLSLIPKAPIAGNSQALSLISDILSERGDRLSPAECLRRISAHRNGAAAAALSEGLEAEYRARLHAAGLRDLDDILEEALDVDVSGMDMFKNLLVDEYQDVNALQRRLVAHWLSTGGTLFVIGDPDQSIYGFRGASAGCFNELKTLAPDMRTITLTKNYRSTPQVLNTALSVIAQNPGGIRSLAPVRPSGVPVRAVLAPDPISEGRMIAREIARMTGGVDMASAVGSSGRAFSDIAVICRTRRQLARIESCLSQEGVPCMIVGRDETLMTDAVHGALAFFRTLVFGADALSVDCALKNLWHVGDEARARAVSAENFDPAALEISLGACSELRPWLDALKVFAPRVNVEKPRKLIGDLAALTSSALEPLMDAALFYRDMPALLAALDVGDDADIRRICGGNYASGAVTLMTVHGSKGLEFPAVFLAGLNRGEFPSENAADLREERRLFFVGLTRARDELIVSAGGERSRFIDELPMEIPREIIKSYRPKPVYEQLSFF